MLNCLAQLYHMPVTVRLYATMPQQFSEEEKMFIEDIAQQRVKFNRILMEQTAILRGDDEHAKRQSLHTSRLISIEMNLIISAAR